MFFTLPDGDRFQSKTTKRGQHVFGLIGRYEFMATAGPNAGQMVSHWTLISQHLTKQAALTQICKGSDYYQDIRVITAA